MGKEYQFGQTARPDYVLAHSIMEELIIEMKVFLLLGEDVINNEDTPCIINRIILIVLQS